MRIEDTAVLRAIVETTDPTVTVSHKLRALELLKEAEDAVAPDGTLVLAEWVNSLSDAELEKELSNFVAPEVERQGPLLLGLCPPDNASPVRSNKERPDERRQDIADL